MEEMTERTECFCDLSTAIELRSDIWPSQYITYALAHVITDVRNILPFFSQWTWYVLRRVLLILAGKYAIDNFWLWFKKRKLGVTYVRDLSLMYWVPSSFYYDLDHEMRVFIRKCGYHFSPEGIGLGKKIQPWFYGDIKDETKQILERMELKALKGVQMDKLSHAGELEAISRILKNFKHFTMDETIGFFKKSELMTMEVGDSIFEYEDKEEYFFGVVSGEIHLFCEGLGDEPELIKVADSEECIVSVMSFIHNFTIGPQTYGELKLFAKCGAPGKYYRIPIAELINYVNGDLKHMSEVISNVLIRQHRFCIEFNNLTGMLPRLTPKEYLNGEALYTPIDFEPGILTGPEANDALLGLSNIFDIDKEDRKLCWVGVLDSRTILLRRFTTTHYAFYIHKGVVACTVSKLRRLYNAVQYYLSTGEVVGWREAVTGYEMTLQYQVADGKKALIVAIPDYLVRRYFEKRPQIVAGLIKKLLSHYSLLCRQINYTLRFTHKNADEAVYSKYVHTEQSETYAYLCLSGRMRFILESEMKGRVARYGIIEKGDWFGLVAMYTDSPTMHRTVICDRLAEYVAVPRRVFTLISREFREVAGYQCDYLARQVHRDHEQTFLETDKMADARFQINPYGAHTWRTYGMVCVYPAASFIPGKIYCDELARHHSSSVKVVTREDALSALQVTEFNREYEYYLAKWLVNQEDNTTILLVLACSEFTDLWNEAIAKLCDMIQVLVTYELPHNPDDNENNILRMAHKARKELVFLHPVIRVTKPQIGPSKFPHLPIGSILWLKPRPWVQRHHHVRILDSAMRYMREKNREDLKKYYKDTKDPDKHSDYARVMRWISGQSVGLVLGGGGAKGAAHLGALQYLHELDVPVDYVAGVSIGSFLGALYAMFEDIYVVEYKAKELWEELKNPVRYIRDLSFNPYSSISRGHAFNWMINYFFSSIQIEDLYIPYFCVSSDLDDKCSRTHMSGDLWFYVRASMTLTYILPPQINQFDFHLLMDGGYSDLVPAMTMKKLGIKYMIAINIGDERLKQTYNIGYHVSGFKCMLQNLIPYLIDSIPNYFDFWDAILYCSARNFIQILKAMDEYCIYIRPNINAYTGNDWQNYDEIKTLGYLSTQLKFGGLHLKRLPVHVIWYLLRFYTYPTIAMSQAQLLNGFNEDDWDFAVDLMSKTQMFQRADTTFLKMNLTPYLTDLMEARSYLEKILQQDEIKQIDLSIPVLENFRRDDEKLDLVHAIARMKEWTYMEDFETIIKNKGKQMDLKVKTKLRAASSQTNDLVFARNSPGTVDDNAAIFPQPTELLTPAPKGSYSVKDMYHVDPSIFQTVQSYHQFRASKQSLREERALMSMRSSDQELDDTPSSDLPFSDRSTSKKGNKRSLPSLHSIIAGFTRSATFMMTSEKQAMQGQRFEEFRMCKTSADRNRDEYAMKTRKKFTPIVTLKELRRSFASKGITEL